MPLPILHPQGISRYLEANMPNTELQTLIEELVSRFAAAESVEQSETPIKYFESPREAAEDDPETYGTADSVRWLLRNRKTNGLLESGAVVERINRPGQTRPKLTIVHPKWVMWKATPHKNQAA
jgi:hypothetical protein